MPNTLRVAWGSLWCATTLPPTRRCGTRRRQASGICHLAIFFFRKFISSGTTDEYHIRVVSRCFVAFGTSRLSARRAKCHLRKYLLVARDSRINSLQSSWLYRAIAREIIANDECQGFEGLQIRFSDSQIINWKCKFDVDLFKIYLFINSLVSVILIKLFWF